MTQKRFGLSLAILVAVLASAAAADQAAYVSREQAQRGYDLIVTGGKVRHFCAPCGDTVWRTEDVTRKSVRKADFQDYFEVLVNDAPVDLAYLYVERDGRWTNVARLAGIEVSDVPEVLDEAAVRAGVAGRDDAEPPTPPRHDYRGLIDGRLEVYMTLFRNGADLEGTYQYTSRGIPIELRGTVDDEGAYTLTETVDGKKTGMFAGAFASDLGRMAGSWLNPDGSRRLSFTADRVARSQVEEMKADLGKAALEGTLAYPEFVQPDLARGGRLTEHVRSALQAAYETFQEDAREMARELEATPPGPFYYSAGEYEIALVSETLASLYLLESTYSGGAHPNSYYRVFNLHLEPDGQIREVGLADAFRPGADFLGTLSKYILADLRKQEAQWVVDGTLAAFTAEELGNFVVTPRGLRFLFSPYAVGPYAQGLFQVDVPWKALDGVLNRDGVIGSLSLPQAGDRGKPTP